MSGWIKLHRSLKYWEWYDDINATRLLVHLLVSVNYEPKKWQGITIEPGSLITSYDHLSDETGLSKQQIRTALKKLENSEEITRQRTRHCLHISLVKWGKLQSMQLDDNSTSTLTSTRHQLDDNLTITPTKEVNNNKKGNNLKKEEKEDSTHTSTSEGAHTLSKKFQGLKFLLDLGVDRDVANDFIKCRTKKRLANTKTAFDGLKREIEKTGRMPNEIIRVAAEQGWGGFRASWDWQKHFESEDTEGLMDWDEMVPG